MSEVNESFFTPGGLPAAVAEADPELEAELAAKAAEEYDFLNVVHSFAEVKDNLPPLKKEVIKGVLRQSHKMILSAPSKAGKSFMVIQLAIALAEGRPWIDFPCSQSRVLYLNFEVDAASFDHRVDLVYKELDWSQLATENLLIKNLRGKVRGRNNMKEIIIAWAQKCRAEAIIFDPIYKLGLKDENSASEVAKLCDFFDEIAEATGASIIYAHHFGKGIAAAKDPIDRASGSGVFARDADAIVAVTPTNKEKYYVMEFSLREFKPVGRRGVRRQNDTIMVRDADADDLPLHGEQGGNALASMEKKEGHQKQKRLEQAKRAMLLLKTGEVLTKKDFKSRVQGSLNIGRDQADDVICVAIANGYIAERAKRPGDDVPKNTAKVLTLPEVPPVQDEFPMS